MKFDDISIEPHPYFADANHSLLMGQVIGLLMAAEKQRWSAPTRIEVLRDGENYTNQVRLTRPSGSYLLTLAKEDPGG